MTEDVGGAPRRNDWLLSLLFVTVYGTAFVAGKYGLPYCPPLTFLAIRFSFTAVLALVVAALFRNPWPTTPIQVLHIAIAGSLTVATYTGGSFLAIYAGISPAIVALVMALQPILLSTFARRFLGELLTWKQWLGLAMGLIGVSFVVWHKIDLRTLQFFGLFMAAIALLGVTFGNLYQKRFCAQMSIFWGGAIQSAGAAILLLPPALVFEHQDIIWNTKFVLAVAYLSVVVSLGGSSLLYLMIRNREASKVASLFYLVPVSTAISSYLIFGERVDAYVMVGVAVTAIGVYLANAKGARRQAVLAAK